MSSFFFLYLLTGALAGLSAGLFGVGGGLIIVPVLYYVFSAQGYEVALLMHMALATSLASIVFTSISSSYAHHKRQAVLWPIVFTLSPSILIGAWLGGLIAVSLESENLKPIFAAFEFLVALMMLLNFKTRAQHTTLSRLNALTGGLLIGTLSAIVGIGGGSLTVPYLNWNNIQIKKAIATSAACGFPIALAATASFIYAGWSLQIKPVNDITTNSTNLDYISLGYVNLTALFLIVCSSFLFAPLGARLAHYLPEKNLKKYFGLFLLLLSAKMLFA